MTDEERSGADEAESTTPSERDRPTTDPERDRPTTDPERDRPATRPMTDTDTATTETGEPTAAAESAAEPSDGDRDRSADGRLDRLSTDRLRGVLDRVGLAALVLLALVAGWSFYSQTGAAIRTWLDPAYQPIALAAFNLAILLVALAGVAHQLTRIRANE